MTFSPITSWHIEGEKVETVHCTVGPWGTGGRVYGLQKDRTVADWGPAPGSLATELREVPVPLFMLPSDGNTLARTWGTGGKKIRPLSTTVSK